jgi:hypothetical protein
VIRRALGLLWLAAWFVVRDRLAAPWRELGGLVSERLRWLMWLVLTATPILGATLGALMRQIVPPRTDADYAVGRRRLLVPALALTALALVVLRCAGASDAISIVFAGAVGYWAGIDAAFSAWPLLAGRRLEPPAESN